jgi:serine protease Do
MKLKPAVVVPILLGVGVAGAVAYANWNNHDPAAAGAPDTRATAAAFVRAMPTPGLDDVEHAVVALAATVRPAVVSIARRSDGGHVSPQAGMRFLDPYADGTLRIGSGTVVDPRGYILTSAQVAGLATSFTVTWPGPPEYRRRAYRVADDRDSDLVLLKAESNGNLPAVSLGNSDTVKIGDLVLAFGTPFGFASTTTLGIVGSNRREVAIEGRRLADMIQTDARLNPGDSGGPLVNIAGELVGVNVGALTMNSTFVGIGFAIASNRARALLARL